MKDRLFIFGFGLDFACAAAMAKLRFPRAELMPVSTSYLPRFLGLQAEAPRHRHIIILGVGLVRDPERLGAALLALKVKGIRVVWISVLSPPTLPKSVLDTIEIALGSGWLSEHVSNLLGTPQNQSAAARIMRLLVEPSTSEDRAWIELLEAAISVFTRQRKTEVLVDAVKSLIRGEMSSAQRRLQADYHEHGDLEIKGRSPAIQELKETARRVAASKVFCVLLEGECGTDSHLLARFIHDSSAHADAAYRHYYAGAIASGQVLREAWQAAAGGSLVLADIDDLAPPMQGALLDLLDMRTPQLARLIVTTQRPLLSGIDTGFRGDLYWRISGMRLTLPPLRYRPRDIAVIANDFALSTGRKRLPADRLQLLEAYEWPGNAVQLRGFLERMFTLVDADWAVELASEALRHPLADRERQRRHVLVPCDGVRLQDIVGAHVRTSLDLHNGNKTHCAKTLGISVNTLKRHLKTDG